MCGAQGAFDKDENLAFTFVEKAARKGFGNAEFVMGYYKEVGVKDIDAAQMCYQLVSRAVRVLGWLVPNPERYIGFRWPSPQLLSRQEHDAITDSKFVRKCAQANERLGRETSGALRPSLESG